MPPAAIFLKTTVWYCTVHVQLTKVRRKPDGSLLTLTPHMRTSGQILGPICPSRQSLGHRLTRGWSELIIWTNNPSQDYL